MNMIQQKIYKTSKSVSIVLLVSCGLVLLVALLFVLGIGILSFSNNTLSSSLQGAFSVLTSSEDIKAPSINTLIILFILAVVQLIPLFFLMYVLYRIFSDISLNYTPFVEVQVDRMKQAAILTLVLGVSSNLFDVIATTLVYGRVTLTLNIVWIVIAAVIFSMAHIFDYGYQLQKMSDETL